MPVKEFCDCNEVSTLVQYNPFNSPGLTYKQTKEHSGCFNFLDSFVSMWHKFDDNNDLYGSILFYSIL